MIMESLQHASANVLSALGMTWKPKVNRMLGEFMPPLFTTGTDYYAGVDVWAMRSLYYEFTDRELMFMHAVRSNDGRYTLR